MGRRPTLDLFQVVTRWGEGRDRRKVVNCRPVNLFILWKVSSFYCQLSTCQPIHIVKVSTYCEKCQLLTCQPIYVVKSVNRRPFRVVKCVNCQPVNRRPIYIVKSVICRPVNRQPIHTAHIVLCGALIEKIGLNVKAHESISAWKYHHGTTYPYSRLEPLDLSSHLLYLLKPKLNKINKV
jgi:hypothetical protein